MCILCLNSITNNGCFNGSHKCQFHVITSIVLSTLFATTDFYLHYNWKLIGLLDQTNSPPINSPHSSPLIRPTNFQPSHRSLSRSITVYLSTYLTPAPPSTPVVPPNHFGWRRRCGGRTSGCWRGRRWSLAACWATRPEGARLQHRRTPGGLRDGPGGALRERVQPAGAGRRVVHAHFFLRRRSLELAGALLHVINYKLNYLIVLLRCRS